MSSSLLLDEPPLTLQSKLAVAVGLNEAIALQQIHYLLNDPRNGKVLGDGFRYIFNTYAGWKDFFPFWSESSIKRVLMTLEERGLVISQQPDGYASRKKYYRVDRQKIQEAAEQSAHPSDEIVRSSGQIEPMDQVKLSRSIGSNPSDVIQTKKTSKKTSTNPAQGPVSSGREDLFDCPIDPGKQSASEINSAAEAIYKLYPLKVARQKALKAIRDVLRTEGEPKLVEAVSAYAEATAAWPEEARQYIPHPATWFNRGSYDDDRSTWVRKNHSNAHPKSNGRGFSLNNEAEYAELDRRMAAGQV